MSEKGSSGQESPIINLPEIDRSLAILKGFEADRINQDVLKAHEVMREVFSPYFDLLNSRKIVITYHGSLQYHDPINLDPDIFFISEQKLQHEEFLFIDNVFEKELSHPDVWPINPVHPDLGYESIEKIKKAAIEHEGISEYDEDEDELNVVGHASYVISSGLLFEEQEQLFSKYQKEVRKLSETSPWLQDGINQVLQRAISIRQARRQ